MRSGTGSPPPTFVAIDFETGDYGRDSACAVAVVRVERGTVAARRHELIRPPRPTIIWSHLHGIEWKHVQRKPRFAQVWPRLATVLEGAEFIAAHNAAFDRGVLEACCAAAGLAPPALPWRCTVKLARSVWGFRKASLDRVCAELGIELDHHQALSDAEACAEIVRRAWGRGVGG